MGAARRRAYTWGTMSARRRRAQGGSLAGSLLALSLLLAAGAPRARATSAHDRRFFSVKHGVGIEAPSGWTLSQHTGYPSILVVLIHPDGSRISLSAAPTPAKDAAALADQNRRGLAAQKMSLTRQSPGPRGGVLVEARRSDRDEIVRQLYIVRPLPDGHRQAVVLTLATRSDHLAPASLGFDWTVAHLLLEEPGDTPGTAVDQQAAKTEKAERAPDAPRPSPRP